MSNPIVHAEIRSTDPDATRTFLGALFGWTFPPGAIPGYTYVDSGVPAALPAGISPLQEGSPLVTFFVGVKDIDATISEAARLGGSIVQEPSRVPGVQTGVVCDHTSAPSPKPAGVGEQPIRIDEPSRGSCHATIRFQPS